MAQNVALHFAKIQNPLQANQWLTGQNPISLSKSGLAFLAKVLSSPKGDQGRVGRRRAGPLMERLTISRAASCSPKTFVLPLT